MDASIHFLDSHTEGEPTRVVLTGGPDLGSGPLGERAQRLREQFDDFRSVVVLEPRANAATVGALLCEPVESDCVSGVIFFNNRGVLGMCGHGAIGVAITLAHLGRIESGRHRIETPVGVVQIELCGPNEASIENVPSHRHRKGVEVEVPGLGKLRGDVAWGGNWFFLVDGSPTALTLQNAERLRADASRVMDALREQGITGEGGAEIDHVEFFATTDTADSRNFVLCPGGEYDRSPCGTGTSAKLACLAEDGLLAPGEHWVQEGILGSRFHASYRLDADGRVVPTIRGRAYLCAEGTLLRHPDDPYRDGIR